MLRSAEQKVVRFIISSLSQGFLILLRKSGVPGTYCVLDLFIYLNNLSLPVNKYQASRTVSASKFSEGHK